MATIRIGELTFVLGPVPVEPPAPNTEPAHEEHELMPEHDDLADMLHGAK